MLLLKKVFAKVYLATNETMSKKHAWDEGRKIQGKYHYFCWDISSQAVILSKYNAK